MFPKDINIILAEDSPTMRALIRDILRGLGYLSIVEAVDGIEAFEKIEAMKKAGKSIDLVIADWNMPRLNGIDLLVKLKSEYDYYNTIPFLMVTSENDTSLVALALSSGADEFIIKPVTAENLSEKLQSIWATTQKK